MTHDESSATLRVADLGEFALIDRLAAVLREEAVPARSAPADELAIGDDAAAWRPTPDRWEILTTDALVENVHFRLSTTTWRELGWKALAENVSDVAAMGGRPRRAFVTLGLPPETPIAGLEELYRGMAHLACEFDLVIAGGDTVAAPVVFLSVTVVGEVEGPGLRRSAGQPGDLLAVTGVLGGSAAGLEILEAGGPGPGDDVGRSLAHCHRNPWPRVRQGLVLNEAGIRCGMDLSDGLLGDAAKLARASGVGATIALASVPMHPCLEERFGPRAAELALTGGEDYELLVAAPADVIGRAEQALRRARLGPLSVVGRLEPGHAGQVRVVDAAGRPIQPSRASWDHFGRSGTRR